MKRKVFVIIIVILIVPSVILALFFNSNYYYSKKLVSAIEEENIIAVRQIIETKPTCINTYPTITSNWWHSAMNWSRTYYPLNVACTTGNIDLIELLIENGADVNCNDGLTPLSITYGCKVENWYDISLILIENGASLDYTTEYSGGKSSVLQDIVLNRHGAAYKPESEEKVIKSFNYALENCDLSNVDWMSVLQYSVVGNRMEIVKLILDKGYCDINDNSIGMTALMFAARDSTPEMVQLLLDYGADKTLKSSDGETAYDLAVQFNNKDVISMLEN